ALPRESQVVKTEAGRTWILYGNERFLKIYRRLEEEINPELEIIKFLTEKTAFPHLLPFLGAVEYRRSGSEPVVIGLLQGVVPNQGEAWDFTVDAVGRYLERVLSKKNELQAPPKDLPFFLTAACQEISPFLQELIMGVHLEMVRLLGRRTAELHL